MVALLGSLFSVAQSSIGHAEAAKSATPIKSETPTPSEKKAAEPQPKPTDTAIAHDPSPDEGEVRPECTRFIINLDRKANYQVFSLSNPNRVIVELGDVKMRLPLKPNGGLVSKFQGGISAPGQSRVVIDVTAPVIVEKAEIEASPDGKGYRLAIEIVPVEAPEAPKEKIAKVAAPPTYALGGATFTPSAKPPTSAEPETKPVIKAVIVPPMPRPAVRPEVRAAKTFKDIIVLDPGHGGHDSGAMKHGTVEKDVVLAFAKVLRTKLEATGKYKVYMTRETDVFIPLHERREYAERKKAGLFIAVHADYASSQAKGASIYSLRSNVAESLKRSAKGEVSEKVLTGEEAKNYDKASGDTGVRTILADLAGRELDAKERRTNAFTRTVIEDMGLSTEMRENPDQQRAFAVLRTAQFPSILIELAYVSNKDDAELLKSDIWRDKVSASVLTAVDNYFSHKIERFPM